MHWYMEQTVQISRNSGLNVTMVPWLHQCILYMKRKLRECRTQKFNRWFGAKSPLCSTGLQSTRFHAAIVVPTVQISRDSWILKSMVPWLQQCIYYIKRKLREWRTQKCYRWFGAKSPLRSTGLQITRFHAVAYRSDSADFPKSGDSCNHGTVIAPMHSLYRKEATGMENPKM